MSPTTEEHWALKGYFFPLCRFGSFVYSNQTGIILNNELADFCITNRSIKPGEYFHPQNKTQGQVVDMQAMYKWAGTTCKLQVLFPLLGLDESEFVLD